MQNEERCNLLNNNTVLVAKHFQYKVEIFPNEIIVVLFGKNNFFAIRIEFQERSIQHVDPFTWIFNTPNSQIEDYFIELIEKTRNG